MAWYYTFNPPAAIGGDRITKPGITESNPIENPQLFIHKEKDSPDWRKKIIGLFPDEALSKLGFKKIAPIEGGKS